MAVPLRVKALGIAVLMLLIGGRQWLALLAQCAWVVLWTVVWPFAELVLHCWGAGWLAFLTVEKAQQWLALRRAAPRRQRPIRVQPWEPIPARPDRPAITSNCLDARPVEYRWVDQPDVTA
ncbi:MAG: hypothetical protein ACJ73S_03630 [Mycobacteriales bacterium]